MQSEVHTSYYAKIRSLVRSDYYLVQISNGCKSECDHVLKSAIPDWNTLVGPHKNGGITNEQYAKLYIDQLDRNAQSIISDLTRLLHQIDRTILLLCFEAPDKFCHRHILAKWLSDKIGITITELT